MNVDPPSDQDKSTLQNNINNILQAIQKMIDDGIPIFA